MIKSHCLPAVLVFLFVLISTGFTYDTDVTDEINTYIRTGNARELANRFTQTVQLTILDEEDIYSKAQAEIIMKDFFAKHSPKSIKVIHSLTSNPLYRFNVLILSTANGNFRVSYSMKSANGKFNVTEIRVESN
ncbi:DUF4783 domain-containing protein [Pedobacter sp. HMF7647]|uniref:DUF4783 domain-containing protein n=1 Tax=Hufsiella arboris TaxID=2695275 RepID=A0A7K1YA95_9SPHI|nr:DUF4783 domain-containing protein [Hufsiella arboris]MXV51350.1 DUF4783 domain-containing protein [Hufsiella arboris]